MRLSYEYGTQKIEFEVSYRPRKTLTIEVEAPGIVTVIAPEETSEAAILEKVKSKSRWIVQKLFEIREIEHKKYQRQYVNGETFSYLGRNYSLQIQVDPTNTYPEAKLVKEKLTVFASSKDELLVKKAVENWYYDRAKERIHERVKYYQHFFDVKPTRITIKDQKKRWGSCTKNRELLFNWRCVMAPAPSLDYIVVHEMSHMVYMSHSKDFWHLLKRVLPDYEVRREWLKNHGVKYDL